MKAVRINEPKNVVLADIEKPTPKAVEALISIITAGICGSDIGAFRGTNNLVSYPRIIGHELAGIIESIPEDNPKGLKIGDKVIADPYLYCGHCYPCSIGRTNCCTDLHVLGVHVDGGMAEYFCHPADMLVKMPDDMSWEEAAMAEPLTISLHGIHRGGLKAGEYCAIIGAGPIGLLAGIDRILNMARVIPNIVGDAAAAVVVDAVLLPHAVTLTDNARAKSRAESCLRFFFIIFCPLSIFFCWNIVVFFQL